MVRPGTSSLAAADQQLAVGVGGEAAVMDTQKKRQKKKLVRRPEMCKDEQEFRNYKDSQRQLVVQRHYKLMRQNQTVEFHSRQMAKLMERLRAGTCKMSIRECFMQLENYVDSSDPDSELPNVIHALQTAEGIRKAGEPEWFQLVGLLHDMGKVMFLWGDEQDGQQGTADGDQWALGGDTWVVGAAMPKSLVFPEYNELNPDMQKKEYSSKYGIYKPNCGIQNLKFAFGHDEYMYQMLKFNQAKFPEQALHMCRLHSCYPWHSSGEYDHLMKHEDHETKRWVQKFNNYDLYTKTPETLKTEELWPYYQNLIDKFCPGKLCW